MSNIYKYKNEHISTKCCLNVQVSSLEEQLASKTGAIQKLVRSCKSVEFYISSEFQGAKTIELWKNDNDKTCTTVRACIFRLETVSSILTS